MDGESFFEQVIHTKIRKEFIEWLYTFQAPLLNHFSRILIKQC